MKTLLFLLMLSITPMPGQTVGNPAPGFTLNSLDHGSISLSSYQGKVVFIFFLGYS